MSSANLIITYGFGKEAVIKIISRHKRGRHVYSVFSLYN